MAAPRRTGLPRSGATAARLQRKTSRTRGIESRIRATAAYLALVYFAGIRSVVALDEALFRWISQSLTRSS